MKWNDILQGHLSRRQKKEKKKGGGGGCNYVTVID